MAARRPRFSLDRCIPPARATRLRSARFMDTLIHDLIEGMFPGSTSREAAGRTQRPLGLPGTLCTFRCQFKDATARSKPLSCSAVAHAEFCFLCSVRTAQTVRARLRVITIPMIHTLATSPRPTRTPKMKATGGERSASNLNVRRSMFTRPASKTCLGHAARTRAVRAGPRSGCGRPSPRNRSPGERSP
jgi:hypothetical protein